MTQTPNIQKLITHKMALIMCPADAGIGAALNSLAKAGNIGAVCREATAWVESVIALVKTAPDNPYQSDDEIAGAILKVLQERK